MDPVSAAILIGSYIYSNYKADQEAAELAGQESRARRDARKNAAENQNRLVMESYQKRREMVRGIGDSVNRPASPLGQQASQTGTVLTSVGGLGSYQQTQGKLL